LSPPRFASAYAVALLLISISAALVFIWTTRRNQPEITQNPPPNHGIPSPTPTLGVNPQMTPAAEGDTIAVSPSPQPDELRNAELDSQIVVNLSDGASRVTLDSQGNIEGLGTLSPAAQQAVKNALISGRLETPPGMAELAGKRGTLLGGPDSGAELSLLGPVGTVVRAERPVFRWRPLTGATSYKVTVLDADFNSVATSAPLTTTAWQPPSGLARGSVYSWQLTAVKADGQETIAPTAPAPEARFKILESEKVRELERAERASRGSHLARGVMYARAGLLDEAERELRALVVANPKSSDARKLLRSLQAAKSKTVKAKK
jgi:hypothetical protein